MIGLEGLLVYAAVLTSNPVTSSLASSLVHNIRSIVQELQEDTGVVKKANSAPFLLVDALSVDVHSSCAVKEDANAVPLSCLLCNFSAYCLVISPVEDCEVAADYASLHGPVELYSRVYVLPLYSVLGQLSTKGEISFCFSILIHCLVFVSSFNQKVRRSGHSS